MPINKLNAKRAQQRTKNEGQDDQGWLKKLVNKHKLKMITFQSLTQKYEETSTFI